MSWTRRKSSSISCPPTWRVEQNLIFVDQKARGKRVKNTPTTQCLSLGRPGDLRINHSSSIILGNSIPQPNLSDLSDKVSQKFQSPDDFEITRGGEVPQRGKDEHPQHAQYHVIDCSLPWCRLRWGPWGPVSIWKKNVAHTYNSIKIKAIWCCRVSLSKVQCFSLWLFFGNIDHKIKPAIPWSTFKGWRRLKWVDYNLIVIFSADQSKLASSSHQ